MPIIIAILFGIGLLLLKDPSKLPWFLQLIRAGLVVTLRWVIRLGAVVLVITLCFLGYERYDNNKKLKALLKQVTIDSLAEAKRQAIEAAKDAIAPDYGTDAYWRWRMDHPEEAKKIETERKEAEMIAVAEKKKSLSIIYGSWSRADKGLVSTEDIGIITFKKNGSFFTSTGKNGKYRLDLETEKLYIYYDDGVAESFKLSTYNTDEISGKFLQEDDKELFLLKRPNTEVEASMTAQQASLQ